MTHSEEIKQAKKDRDWWKQFEHDGWRLSGFTERFTASFHKGGLTVQVFGSFMRGLPCPTCGKYTINL